MTIIAAEIVSHMNWIAVLLLVTISQQLWIYLAHRRSRNRDELFRIITENAADMIALVNVKGRRLYNSPAYSKILGYSPAEPAQTPVFEQIHPDDRFKVLEAAREARVTGIGRSLEYRLRHKNGSGRVLESTASTIRNEKGEVEKLVIVNRDITERKRAEEQLAHNALHDAMTGLPNRRLFLDRLQRCFAEGQRDPAFRYAVLILNLDGFKVFNDTSVKMPHGEIILCRLDGNEFGVLLERVKHPSEAMRLAYRVQSELNSPLTVNGREASVAASIGIALSKATQEHAEHLLRDADDAMRRAKAMGGSRSELFDTALHSRAVDRLKLENDLRAALDHNQFQILYQPIQHMESRRIVWFRGPWCAGSIRNRV